MKTIVHGLQQPEGLAVMQDGRIAIVETATGQIIALDSSTSRKQVLASGLQFGISALMAPEDVGVFNGITVGNDGSLYFNEDKTNTLKKISFLSH